jgi:putative glutamine transport system ATP-binding protein
MIEFRHVHKHYGKFEVLKDINLKVNQGDVMVIVGKSGAGKSTLLRCINRLEEISSGELIVNGHQVHQSGLDVNVFRREIGMVFQQFNLYPHKTVLDNVILAPMKVLNLSRDEASARAMNLLKKVGIAEKASAFPDQLSGGQQQRVAIARALAMELAIMLFDEPTSALDPEMTGEVQEVMKQLAREGMTMVVVSHEMDFAHQVASRMVLMEDGKIIEDAPAATFFNAPEKEQTRNFLRRFDATRES